MPVLTRLWFAWVCFFRVLFDGAFAARASAVRHALPPGPGATPEPSAPEPSAPESRTHEPVAAPAPIAAPTSSARDGALQLLALLQREGRLVDFLQQDIAAFDDADIGATARVVHEGCRKALRSHVKVAPLRSEEEGASITLEAGFDAQAVKLTGNVQGKGPFAGTLRHRGWRATDVTLPSTVKGHDPTLICPAEVEL